MTTNIHEHGNLRVDVLDERGEALLGHGRLLLEAAPGAGERERARFEADPRFEVGDGDYVLRLPNGHPWSVALRHIPNQPGLAVISDETPALTEVGGE